MIHYSSGGSVCLPDNAGEILKYLFNLSFNLSLYIFIVTLWGTSLLCACDRNGFETHQAADVICQASEGPVITPIISVGPFDLKRQYGSMQGPYVQFDVKIADLVKSKEIVLGESMVNFLEANVPASPPTLMELVTNSYGTALGVARSEEKKRKLYWLKAVKIILTDESDRPLRQPEFFCHFNLDVNPDFRNATFRSAQKCNDARLITLTQGQMEMRMPTGFAIPVASDEVWQLTFQAVNRFKTLHRRVKQQCTFYFLDDSQLEKPITALAAYAPFITVKDDGKQPHCSADADCDSCKTATKIGSMSLVPLQKGETGHWAVPPGVHVYEQSARTYSPDFGKKPITIHAAWAHVNPYCQSFSLVEKNKTGERNIFTLHSQTRTLPVLGIAHTDFLNSEPGIKIDGAGNEYYLKVQYNNTSNVDTDAMAACAIFYADASFMKMK